MLEGLYKAEKLLIKVEARRAFATKEDSWPAGRVAQLTQGQPHFHHQNSGRRMLVGLCEFDFHQYNQCVMADGEELDSNILSQDFALVRSSYPKFTELPFRG